MHADITALQQQQLAAMQRAGALQAQLEASLQDLELTHEGVHSLRGYLARWCESYRGESYRGLSGAEEE